ncbi:unnamed protein product, partial [Arabidopsis halleri]
MESKSIVEALKNKGITGIGAARFCWGGTSNLMNHALRTLVVYPKGNKEDNGRGFVSMYMELDKSCLS